MKQLNVTVQSWPTTNWCLPSSSSTSACRYSCPLRGDGALPLAALEPQWTLGWESTSTFFFVCWHCSREKKTRLFISLSIFISFYIDICLYMFVGMHYLNTLDETASLRAVFCAVSPRQQMQNAKNSPSGFFARHQKHLDTFGGRETWWDAQGLHSDAPATDCYSVDLSWKIYQNMMFWCFAHHTWHEFASRSWLIKSSTWQVSEGRVKNGFGWRHFTPVLSISQTAKAIQESACGNRPCCPCFKAS